MIVTCPECGAKNRIPDIPEPTKIYRCGKCGKRLSYPPKIVDTQDEKSRIDQAATTKGGGDAVKIIGVVLLCLVLVGLSALAGWLIIGEISAKSKECLEIHMSPNAVLREIAQPVDMNRIGEEEQQLTELMINTLEKEKGTVLSAPQVGVSRRIIVIKLQRFALEGELLVMVNPEIVEQEGSDTAVEECLSIPRGESAELTRAEQITVRYWTLQGEDLVLEESGWDARMIQHGIDHLDGVLISDFSKPFKVTWQAVLAISILAAFFLIETRTSLLDDTRKRVGAKEERGILYQITQRGWSRDKAILLGIAFVYLLVVIAAEGFFSFLESPLGIVFYGLILIAIAIHCMRITEHKIRILLLSLALVPLYRLGAVIAGGVTSALDIDSDVAAFALASPLLLIAALVLMRITKLSAQKVYLVLGRLPIQLLIGLTGIVFGPALYYLVKPEPLIPELKWVMLIVSVLVIIIGAGAEELTFRGLLQRTSIDVFGKTGLLYVSLLFAFIHLGNVSGIDISIISIPVIFAIALFYSWAVKMTGSLLGVVLSHLINNIIFFLLMPLLL